MNTVGKKILFSICTFLFISFHVSSAQSHPAVISGYVSDVNGDPVFPANVAANESMGTSTDQEGFFSLKVPSQTELNISISYLGFASYDTIMTLPRDDKYQMNITLKPSVQKVDEISVISDLNRRNNLTSLDLKNIQHIPQTTGNIEDVIKTLPGVSSNTELSSQYSVRGGNYDENLIYVNDVEIYRPFLVQSGQQEGLSFVNPDMISQLQFSAGGFNAQYGDKMSSVLDIQYKRPTSFEGKISASLLGSNVMMGGASNDKKFTHISSFRYKTSQYLLNSLETSGDYMPNFYDLQSYFTYDITPQLELSVLGNISLNDYNFIPKTRDVKFGTIRNAFNLKIFYEGQEMDRFFTGLGAFTARYSPNDKINVKLITSYFTTAEEITYDLLGQYSINLLDNTIGSESAGDSISNIGVGSFLEHTRNYLYANVYNAEVRTTFHQTTTSSWKAGVKIQREIIDDQVEEWEYVDSALYSSPYNDETVDLSSSVFAKNTLASNRYTSFIQYSGKIHDFNNHSLLITAGLRGSYWDVNRQFTLSPRLNLFITPLYNKRVNYHLATGIYFQPPFYKELRDPEGVLHKDLKAQVSYQYVAGMDYHFELWDRPFKFTTEAYYKYMPRLTVYKVDNVSIQYLPEYRAKGYTMGIDFKVNGEFLPGTESWASLSFLESKEDIYQDKYLTPEFKLKNPGYYPRPTDQLFNFSMYFQDYFPTNPDYKVHLMLHYGAKLPTNPPDYNNPSITFRLPPYRRIDMGIAKKLTKRNSKEPIIQGFKDIWISAEIFNLFGFENTVSYQWIKTIRNQDGISNTFAVPNHLTSRRINFKLQATF